MLNGNRIEFNKNCKTDYIIFLKDLSENTILNFRKSDIIGEFDFKNFLDFVISKKIIDEKYLQNINFLTEDAEKENVLIDHDNFNDIFSFEREEYVIKFSFYNESDKLFENQSLLISKMFIEENSIYHSIISDNEKLNTNRNINQQYDDLLYNQENIAKKKENFEFDINSLQLGLNSRTITSNPNMGSLINTQKIMETNLLLDKNKTLNEKDKLTSNNKIFESKINDLSDSINLINNTNEKVILHENFKKIEKENIDDGKIILELPSDSTNDPSLYLKNKNFSEHFFLIHENENKNENKILNKENCFNEEISFSLKDVIENLSNQIFSIRQELNELKFGYDTINKAYLTIKEENNDFKKEIENLKTRLERKEKNEKEIIKYQLNEEKFINKSLDDIQIKENDNKINEENKNVIDMPDVDLNDKEVHEKIIDIYEKKDEQNSMYICKLCNIDMFNKKEDWYYICIKCNEEFIICNECRNKNIHFHSKENILGRNIKKKKIENQIVLSHYLNKSKFFFKKTLNEKLIFKAILENKSDLEFNGLLNFYIFINEQDNNQPIDLKNPPYNLSFDIDSSLIKLKIEPRNSIALNLYFKLSKNTNDLSLPKDDFYFDISIDVIEENPDLETRFDFINLLNFEMVFSDEYVKKNIEEYFLNNKDKILSEEVYDSMVKLIKTDKIQWNGDETMSIFLSIRDYKDLIRINNKYK